MLVGVTVLYEEGVNPVFKSMICRYRSLLILVLLVVPLVMWTSGCGEKEEGQHDRDAHAHTPSDSAATKPALESTAKLSDDYPLTTCVVSGNPLDAMGGAFVMRDIRGVPPHDKTQNLFTLHCLLRI